MSDYPVYILGLKENFRGHLLENHLAQMGFSASRVEGVPKAASLVNNYLTSSLTFAKFSIRRPLTPGEVACFLGHQFMYSEFLASRAEWGVFLEDDAILTGNLKALTKNLKNSKHPIHLTLHGAPSLDIEVGEWNSSSDLLNLSDSLSKRLITPPAGAFGYLMNRQAALLVVERGKLGLASIADWPYYWPTKIRNYRVKTPLISHPISTEQSQIGLRPANFEKWRHRIPNLFRLWKSIRFGIPFIDSLRKEVIYKLITLTVQSKRAINGR